MRKLAMKQGTLRQESRHSQRPRFLPKKPTGTVSLRKTPRGQLVFTLPPSTQHHCHWRAGSRVWFLVNGQTLVVTLKPWGPYPGSGHRISNRLIGVRGKLGRNSLRNGRSL
jgi:hypothetical protein